jgi:hypothetical protein
MPRSNTSTGTLSRIHTLQARAKLDHFGVRRSRLEPGNDGDFHLETPDCRGNLRGQDLNRTKPVQRYRAVDIDITPLISGLHTEPMHPLMGVISFRHTR